MWFSILMLALTFGIVGALSYRRWSTRASGDLARTRFDRHAERAANPWRL